MTTGLSRVVQWGQQLLAEVVEPGSLTVDLTAGRGQDTLILSRMVGHSGQVIAFDVQLDALELTRERLAEAGVEVRLHADPPGLPLPVRQGVDLLQLSHAALDTALPKRPRGVIANLGYLPGGRQDIITRPESTLQALQQAGSCLETGGRMAIVVYPGHPGGQEEGDVVTTFFNHLDDREFQVLQMKVCNRSSAPFLFVAEKLV